MECASFFTALEWEFVLQTWNVFTDIHGYEHNHDNYIHLIAVM